MHKYQFKSLRDHCFDLSYFCIYFHHQHPQAGYLKIAAEWLRTASRMKNVRLQSYSSERQSTDSNDLFQLLQRGNHRTDTDHVLNLTLFNLIWAAFEFVFSDKLVNPDNKKIAGVLAERYEPHHNLVGLNGLESDLKRQLRQSEVFRGRTKSILSRQKTRSAAGILLVMHIRKLFAHLQEQFPAGMDFQEKKSIGGKIILISSRLTLLTLQMLLFASLAEYEEYINLWWKPPKSREKIIAHTFLRTVHLADHRFKNIL